MKNVKAVDIESALSSLEIMEGRTPHSPEEEVNEAFATLAPFDSGGVFVGAFVGDSPWERHAAGDELVHIIKGTAQLIILSDGGEQTLTLGAGMVTVVPKGLWHRFHAPNGVTVLTATPQPTEHSVADDPRK